jgi:hypothetical protein
MLIVKLYVVPDETLVVPAFARTTVEIVPS